ncbi:hypothetical protein [Geomonas terrae]|nr:hypothetical protein [Geomonas terrae]
MSGFVEYECLYKPRKGTERNELRARLAREKKLNKFATVNMAIEDLQEVSRLEERRRLGRGELSAIAIAKKLNLGLTTDDRKAFRLAQEELPDPIRVQTIPQLLGWLLFIGVLTDGDVPNIIKEHTDLGGSHQSHFEEIYLEAMRCKLASN